MNIIDVAYKWTKPLGKRKETNIIVLHHAKAKICSVDDIHQWHLQNGWAGIGYNFFIRKDGSIYKGRPDDAVGAHVEGRNYDSIGISFEGDFEIEVPTEQQKASCVDLIRLLRTHYGNLKVVGHRDVGNSSCPGRLFPMDEIQKRIGGIEMTLDEAIQFLLREGVINSPEYRRKVCDVVQYEKEFVIAIAQKIIDLKNN